MSNATLTVSLNAERPHDLSVRPTFTTTDTFAVEFVNEGQAVHVHLNIDDELSRVVSLPSGNHFVDGGQTKLVTLPVRSASKPVSGKLKIVSGYGSETAYVDVTVNPGTGGKPPVDIDETLSKPATREPEPGLVGTLGDALPGVDSGAVPLLVLAGIALVLAIAVASVFESIAITLGAGAVVAGVFVALALAIQ
ncbi:MULTISPECIES: hypothetical protein [Haloferax]|uniref:Uncharacterized protein n=1 Tax=Haloferax marinum TaxID=2666143 RepID=A0A6A8G3A6_9EURY|nr:MULTISPECIES: hypothetical protein [Haloferax]KAB1196644.1 hypothetical protein Hfx1150_03575 [Haloferax sp. CBA1150]MRW95650.1 hypothetical protein [Haloferax marinum]